MSKMRIQGWVSENGEASNNQEVKHTQQKQKKVVAVPEIATLSGNDVECNFILKTQRMIIWIHDKYQ